ncbi:hypothetical protein CFC21_042233 [Triticum aestivum]|uniref:Syntaxin N-terminal domain-containing protein n=2 Tax=Triticum aestivum TaxID=4565 RepID=A0A9R1FLB5_WHEAT|nr:uncharacterized protein LOC119281527 [Triticum dicoccoides]XP_037417923.1 uncharacterized protein LOC119281527 [Triticum dicoccoides]XP_044344851.1 uncharacterized protein LOC123065680 isoform X1 [Triticum aestivum]XP_044344852.1 uncharacterized protein LOC123065680 isoform X1 [Triticum aestivum]KAF7030764.1 hypothetical protein CFC21_042233 [Triticum aestivum]CDM84133.1 unnamed protein product [Triticum aestivum]
MSLGRPNRGNAAAGRGGGGAALPGALGLGSFPRHDLPAPPDGLDLNAVVAPPVSQVAPAPDRPSHVSVQEFRARVRTLESAFSDADWFLRDIQGEIQQMREEGHEKDRQIRSLVEDAMKKRRSSHIRIKQFDHDKELMRRFFQGCKEKLKKSSDAFREYKKMCEGSGVSSSGVVADEQNRILMMRQEYAENINALERYLHSSFAACAKEITMLATRIAYLNNERQRLNDYIQIPDLNNGGPQL